MEVQKLYDEGKENSDLESKKKKAHHWPSRKKRSN
jgi:hypothetical protein